MNARAEAYERLAGRHDPRVLEPSPPAVTEGPLWADDPVAGGDVVPLDRPGARSWVSLCREADDPELGAWCAARWLGPWKRLEPLPVSFESTRRSLHGLAEHVVAPARYEANAKIGLRFTRDGFGTPYFGAGRQVRVESGVLVVEAAEDPEDPRPLSVGTLGEAQHAAGVSRGAPDVYTPTTPGDPQARLAVDPDAARTVGDWFGFCASVLEQLRAEASDATCVQLRPEHFDLAVDLGDEATGGRANFGGSPGDDRHPEPYLYVGPWAPRAADGDFWNESFGASLSYAELLAAPDQRALALEFLRTGRCLLAPPDQDEHPARGE